jgi:hypothetical protein
LIFDKDKALWVQESDTVEVVRCKDCIHFNAAKALRPGAIWCEYWGTDPDLDDFCSKGERKNNG